MRSKEQVIEMKKLRVQGKTYAEIGKMFGIHAMTVRYHCQDIEEKKRISKRNTKWFMDKPLKERQKYYKNRSKYFKNWYQKLKEDAGR